MVWEEHFHSNYELIYAMEGCTDVTVGGKVDTLSAGELILVSPYTIHSIVTRSAKTWVGVFSEDFVPLFDARNRYVQLSKFRADADVMNILKERLFVSYEPERYTLVACLYLILGECVKNAVRTAVADSSLMRLVPEYVSAHITEDISLGDLATALGYEYHYFSFLFHSSFSMNFKRFINIFRFNTACKLLSDKSVDISAVAELAGFGSQRNFNRVFKELSGISPREYRIRMKV